ncbi:hypothetical protein PYCC9005_005356 [Savitreella phatthalungensis]
MADALVKQGIETLILSSTKAIVSPKISLAHKLTTYLLKSAWIVELFTALYVFRRIHREILSARNHFKPACTIEA